MRYHCATCGMNHSRPCDQGLACGIHEGRAIDTGQASAPSGGRQMVWLARLFREHPRASSGQGAREPQGSTNHTPFFE